MKIKYLFILLVLFVPQLVFAAPNASISTSASSIENGKSVKVNVTLTDTAAWNIKIVGSGAATCSSNQVDVTSDGKSTTKKFTLSCNSTSEGTITFKVTGDITSGAGETKDISLSKNVTVQRAKSNDNNLSDLKIDGITVAGFSSSKTSYNLKDNNGSSINITATSSDSKATVSGTGRKTLNYGKNTFSITVIAENGSKKIYYVIVNKPDSRSINNNLKSLTIDKGEIQFDRNITTYTIKLEHNINNINISASAEDSKATVSGTGNKVLKDYTNEFNVIVKAENGITKTYTIKVIRKDENGNYGKLNSDNSIKSITIINYDFKFDENQKKYNILIDEKVDKLDIVVTPNNSSSTVSIEGNEHLKSGLNKVIVQVIAENGDINKYLFNIYKMGDETPKKEDTIIDPPKDENNNNNNIWIIVCVIEFLIIIILMVMLLLRKKNNKGIDTFKQQQNQSLNNNIYSNQNNINNNLN